MIIPWDTPRGTIHDLNELADLSAERCHILCVSERTLYLLDNISALDIRFSKRYATLKTDHGYEPVTYNDPTFYPLFLEVVERFQLEVEDMTCDIQTGLEAIAQALGDLSLNINCGCGGGGGGTGGAAPLDCIEGLPNDTLIPPGSEQGDSGVDPPPEGFETWPEYFDYKCKAAEFIWDLERKHMNMLKNFELISLTAAIVGPFVAGLLGVLPAAMTPAGFAVFVTSVVAIGIVAGASWFYMDEMVNWWDTNHDDIVCSLFNSGTSVEAVSGLANALEDAIQAIVSWGALEPVAGEIAGLLGQAFGALAGNGIVEPLFKAVVAATQFTADCSGCEDEGGFFQTALIYPFNRLIIGDSIEANAEDATKGYKSQNSGQSIDLYFTLAGSVENWHFSAEVFPVSAGLKTAGMIIQANTGGGWFNLSEQYSWPDTPGQEWTTIVVDALADELPAATNLRAHMSLQNYNEFIWYRRVAGSPL